LAAGLRPDLLGELMRSPQTSSRNGGILLRAGRKGEGAYFKGRRMGVEGGEREKKGRGRESPKV